MKTVLLVEDNEENRIVYAAALEHAGYRVQTATTGEDAVRIAAERMPDLVLMDISLPGMSGWMASQRIRETEAGAGVPIVAVTAHVLPEHRRHAEVLGLDGFLTKPCPPRALAEEVERHIGPAVAVDDPGDLPGPPATGPDPISRSPSR